MIEKHKERNKLVSPETKLERVTSRLNGEYTIVINSISGENLVFVSVRKAAYFYWVAGPHQSYIAKSLIIKNFYLGRGFLVYKSYTSLEKIIKSEPYKEASTNLNNPVLRK